MSLRASEHIFNGATTPITSYDSTKTNLGSLMIQKSGFNPEDNFVGPMPVAVARPMEESTGTLMMYPHAITISSTIDWVFLIENAVTAAKRIYLYEYNKTEGTYNWKGFITATTQNATNICRGFRALRYLHTTGTVSVAAPAAVLTGSGSITLALAVTGAITGVGATGVTASHIGMMVGFGSTTPSQINCWYPIVSWTSATSFIVSGASNVIAATNAWVVASCVVTGVGTQFVAERIASGTTGTTVASGLGPRIGFGSTNPNLITQWYQIGRITSDTSINIVTSPGVIPAGTSYVIEELRFVIVTTNTTAANGGLFLVKGVSYFDFQTSTVAGPLVLPMTATNVDNQRGVYWIADAATVTNQSACGCAIDTEVSKVEHWAYVINGLSSAMSVYKYNLRANDAVTAGKMTLSGTNCIITGSVTLVGLISHSNNGRIGTLNHGPASGVKSLYFVTSHKLYYAILANITSAGTSYIVANDSRFEVPPGGIVSNSFTYDLASVEIADMIDRLIIVTSGLTNYRSYVTAYPTNDGDEFTHIWGIDDKQQDTSYIPPNMSVHFNTKSQPISIWSENGILHAVVGGSNIYLNHMYALPFSAHSTYASSSNQRVITPSISTSGCVKYKELAVSYEQAVGYGDMRLPTESFKVYYRTSNIASDATSSWVLIGTDRSLTAATPSSAIQFMFEFSTIGNLCIPSRIFNVAVTYEDASTDSHFTLSSSLSSATNEQFAWRFARAFGGTVPNLKVELYNAATDVLLVTDTSDSPANGTWHKSTNGGGAWGSYDNTDVTNSTTYIRYTPTSLTDGVVVRAVLTLN